MQMCRGRRVAHSSLQRYSRHVAPNTTHVAFIMKLSRAYVNVNRCPKLGPAVWNMSPIEDQQFVRAQRAKGKLERRYIAATRLTSDQNLQNSNEADAHNFYWRACYGLIRIEFGAIYYIGRPPCILLNRIFNDWTLWNTSSDSLYIFRRGYTSMDHNK